MARFVAWRCYGWNQAYTYQDETTLDVPEAYRGIGIRIEDTVLIQKDRCQVLSGDLAKDANDIEALMAGAQKPELARAEARRAVS